MGSSSDKDSQQAKSKDTKPEGPISTESTPVEARLTGSQNIRKNSSSTAGQMGYSTPPSLSMATQRSRANASSSGSQTEAPAQAARHPKSNISPKDVKKWMRTGSFGNRDPDKILTPKFKSVEEAIESDENREGQRFEELKSCFSCGGEVAWETKSQLSLVCGKCKRRQ